MTRRPRSGHGSPATQTESTLKPFIVRFDDWTAYKLTVYARDAQHAVDIAQAMSTDELWQAEVLDGGQEGWEAFPALAATKGGAA